MKQYIDKDAVFAEIKRRIKEIDEIGTYLSPKGVLTNLLCHLDTLEVKEVGVDLGDPKGDKSAKYIIETKTLEIKEVDLEKELDFNAEVSKFIDTFYKNTKIGHKLMIRRTARYFYELGLNAKKGE